VATGIYHGCIPVTKTAEIVEWREKIDVKLEARKLATVS
jgi:hypothetical protein